jgi:hypothetical protein
MRATKSYRGSASLRVPCAAVKRRRPRDVCMAAITRPTSAKSGAAFMRENVRGAFAVGDLRVVLEE